MVRAQGLKAGVPADPEPTGILADRGVRQTIMGSGQREGGPPESTATPPGHLGACQRPWEEP